MAYVPAGLFGVAVVEYATVNVSPFTAPVTVPVKVGSPWSMFRDLLSAVTVRLALSMVKLTPALTGPLASIKEASTRYAPALTGALAPSDVRVPPGPTE